MSLVRCVSLFFMQGPAMAVLPFKHTGNLYVSMWTSDEIAVFAPNGTPLERFTTEGLDGPRGIAFNRSNGQIWVASEFGNSIFIFDKAHRFIRRIEHPDFDEPVGVTFASAPGVDASDQLVYISNSNGNEIMVFDQSGSFQRRFTDSSLQDPNCSAIMPDGNLMVANRLGGTMGGVGAVSTFDNGDNFRFDFTTDGIASLMAVARDPGSLLSAMDDTLWVTSGAGDKGIYEFDSSGNLLTSLLPEDIDDGQPIIPQGIAFDGEGSFYVVSYSDEVLKFSADGRFLMRFPTGSGTSRSTAFQGCQRIEDAQCIPFGVAGADVTNAGGLPNDNSTTEVTSRSGGGLAGWLLIALFVATGGRGWLVLIARFKYHRAQECNKRPRKQAVSLTAYTGMPSRWRHL